MLHIGSSPKHAANMKSDMRTRVGHTVTAAAHWGATPASATAAAAAAAAAAAVAGHRLLLLLLAMAPGRRLRRIAVAACRASPAATRARRHLRVPHSTLS
jgi:hypothetical protein